MTKKGTCVTKDSVQNDRESVRCGKGSMELAREEKLDLSSENNLSKIYLVKRLNC